MTTLREDVKRTAKIISLQKINESEMRKEIEDEVERLIERRFLDKKEDFDTIKDAITLELEQLKKEWLPMRNINKTTKELKELGFNTNDEIIEGLIFEYKDISPRQLKRQVKTINKKTSRLNRGE